MAEFEHLPGNKMPISGALERKQHVPYAAFNECTISRATTERLFLRYQYQESALSVAPILVIETRKASPLMSDHFGEMSASRQRCLDGRPRLE
jgi:hypothetical protein